MGLKKWQAIYFTGAAMVTPLLPFLYMQGQYTRRKVGVLPNAGGPTSGVVGSGNEIERLLVLGESTVAGLGARTHATALTGRFAEQLSERRGKRIDWDVVGLNGVTAKRTITELVPLIPGKEYDHILVALGGNDVLKISSPRKWRENMEILLDILRRDSPHANIFLANCPMIKFSPVMPQPLKGILWQLSKLHDVNIKDLTSKLKKVYYFHQPGQVSEDFWADGIHPSEKGYAEWAEAMMQFFDEKYKWSMQKD